jgi:hypothetical protein
MVVEDAHGHMSHVAFLRRAVVNRIALTPTAQAFGLLLGSTADADTPVADLDQVPGVRVSGTITHVFGNRFVLQDPTGAVLVDTGPEWFMPLAFRVGEKVRVVGEMGDGDFDARLIELTDGTKLTI